MRFPKQAVDEARRKNEEGPPGGGERWGRYGRPIADGTYPCEVVEAKTEHGPNIGEYEILVVRVDAPRDRAPEGAVKVDYRVTAPFKAVNLAEVWPDRVAEDAKGLEVHGADLVGARARAVVFHENDQHGQPRAQIRRFVAAEGAAAPPAARTPAPKAGGRPAGQLRDEDLPF